MKTKLWGVSFRDPDQLVVRLGEGRWKVRSISPRAAARRLIRGGTIAEFLAKREYEWDNPFQPQYEDSPASDRKRTWIRDLCKRLTIVVESGEAAGGGE